MLLLVCLKPAQFLLAGIPGFFWHGINRCRSLMVPVVSTRSSTRSLLAECDLADDRSSAEALYRCVLSELLDKLHFYMRSIVDHYVPIVVRAVRNYTRSLSSLVRARRKFHPHNHQYKLFHKQRHELKERNERLRGEFAMCLRVAATPQGQQIIGANNFKAFNFGHRQCQRHRGKVYVYTHRDIVADIDRCTLKQTTDHQGDTKESEEDEAQARRTALSGSEHCSAEMLVEIKYLQDGIKAVLLDLKERSQNLEQRASGSMDIAALQESAAHVMAAHWHVATKRRFLAARRLVCNCHTKLSEQ